MVGRIRMVTVRHAIRTCKGAGSGVKGEVVAAVLNENDSFFAAVPEFNLCSAGL